MEQGLDGLCFKMPHELKKNEKNMLQFRDRKEISELRL